LFLGCTASLVAPDATAVQVGTWRALRSAIQAAAGKTVTLTLSKPFSMVEGWVGGDPPCWTTLPNGYYVDCSAKLNVSGTVVVIEGNGAVFDGGGPTICELCTFFYVLDGATLVVNNVTMQNAGGGIFSTGNVTVRDSAFINLRNYNGVGGAIFQIDPDNGPEAILSLANCMFINNTSTDTGGAIEFDNTAGGSGLLKNCTFVGPISKARNDVYRFVETANVTFACPDGYSGSPVQMQGYEITVIPPKELQCTATIQTYGCHNGGTANWKCLPDPTSTATLAQCHEVCAP
jgi:predicted outer membrane repeat protein